MGFRIRKSINTGWGFRVNISKSGIGYSWGIPGYRMTKLVNGRVRQTSSIPGTGLSYISESGSCSDNNTNNRHKDSVPCNGNVNVYNDLYNERNYDGRLADTDAISRSDLTDYINSRLKKMERGKAFIGVVLMSAVVAGVFLPVPFNLFAIGIFFILAGYIWHKVNIPVKIEYEFKDGLISKHNERLKYFEPLMKSLKIGFVAQTHNIIDSKYASGATQVVNDVRPCKIATVPPFPVETNINVLSISAMGRNYIFFPDALVIIANGRAQAIDYEKLTMKKYTGKMVYNVGKPPKDAEIVGTTYRYVNKSGDPDKRFKDNPMYPVCRLGYLDIMTQEKRICFQFSNTN